MFIIVAMFSCCLDCCTPAPEYYCNYNEVETIQIVRLGKYIEEEYRFEYTVLTDVSEKEPFVERLNNIKYSGSSLGDPSVLKEQDVVIRIVYKNGDYDLLSSNAQCFRRAGINDERGCHFDDKQFNALIDEYVGDQNLPAETHE